jgi:hypothetical protein
MRLLTVLYIFLALIGTASAQNQLDPGFHHEMPQGSMNGHPMKDQAIHEKFYSTWMMPDHPTASCCSLQDCFPTEARQIGDRWEAKLQDGTWAAIPDEKIERNRDNPDGRNHLCATKVPSMGTMGVTILCFIPGGAT